MDKGYDSKRYSPIDPRRSQCIFSDPVENLKNVKESPDSIEENLLVRSMRRCTIKETWLKLYFQYKRKFGESFESTKIPKPDQRTPDQIDPLRHL